MSLRTCAIHGPYIADTSADFGETWCPECGPRAVSVDTKRDERKERAELERDEAADVREHEAAAVYWLEHPETEQ